MLEAAACGVPLLLSEGCNYPEAAEQGAGRILELTDEAWADAMLALIQDERQRERVGANARALFLKSHTLEKIGEQLETLLQRAAARNRG